MTKVIEYVVTIQSDRVIQAAADGIPSRPGRLNYERLKLAGEYITTATQGMLRRSDLIQSLGKLLYGVLFDEPVNGHFVNLAWRMASSGQALIRLRLVFQKDVDMEVVSAPWEFLYGNDTFLATDSRIALSYQYDDWLREPFDGYVTDGPLRILFVHTHPINLDGVAVSPLRQALSSLDAQLEEVTDPTLGALQEKLDSFRPHVFHFLGHGQCSEGGSAFALVDGAGQALWTADESFGHLFRGTQPLLVVLQSCEGGQLSAVKPFAGGAAWLARRNVPAVVAMRYPFEQGVGWAFARKFYEALARKEPVDRAVQAGREALALATGTSHTTCDFSSPLLWMRLRDGQLFPPLAGKRVSKGFRSLAGLRDQSNVQELLGGFESMFIEAGQRIANLESAKRLHDLFQRIEDSHANIENLGKRVPDDATAWDELERNEWTLQDDASDLLQRSGQAPFGDRLRWTSWMERFGQAVGDQHQAIQSQDGGLLKSTIRRIGDVLARAPSWINEYLVETAHTLQLSTGMDEVRMGLEGLSLDPVARELRADFKRGIDALVELEARLSELIADHNVLQQIDDQLRSVEDTLKQGLDLLTESWSDLEGLTAKLHGGPGAMWFQELKAAGVQLNTEIAAGNGDAIKRAFRKFQALTNRGFNKVDQTLLELCGQLVDASRPLREQAGGSEQE